MAMDGFCDGFCDTAIHEGVIDHDLYMIYEIYRIYVMGLLNVTNMLPLKTVEYGQWSLTKIVVDIRLL